MIVVISPAGPAVGGTAAPPLPSLHCGHSRPGPACGLDSNTDDLGRAAAAGNRPAYRAGGGSARRSEPAGGALADVGPAQVVVGAGEQPGAGLARRLPVRVRPALDPLGVVVGAGEQLAVLFALAGVGVPLLPVGLGLLRDPAADVGRRA